MEVDEGTVIVHRHANLEAVDDEEFFEFQEVEAYYNNAGATGTEEEDAAAIVSGNTSKT